MTNYIKEYIKLKGKYVKENVEIYDEEWDEEDENNSDYYIGEMTYDNIEVYPCDIESDNKIKYPGRYITLTKEEKEYLDNNLFVIKKDKMKYNKLVYIYNSEINKDFLIMELRKFIKRCHMLGVFIQTQMENNIEEAYFIGDGGKIINLI